MFREGKKFHLNIVDFCVILIIILLIVGTKIKFSKFNSKTDETAMKTIEYKIKVYNVREYTSKAVEVGDQVYDSQTGVEIGKITNVESSEAITYEGTSSGDIVKVKNPYRFDVTLTVETPGTVETDAYYANQTIELKVNSEKIIETKYMKTSGIISDLRAVD